MRESVWVALRWVRRAAAAILYVSGLMQLAGYPGDLPTWLGWLAPFYALVLFHAQQKGSLLVLVAIASALLVPDLLGSGKEKKQGSPQISNRSSLYDSLYLGSLVHDGMLWKVYGRHEACGFNIEGPLCPKDENLLGFQRGVAAKRTFPAKATDAVDTLFSTLYCPECTSTYNLGVDKGTSVTFRPVEESKQNALERFCALHPEYQSH